MVCVMGMVFDERRERRKRKKIVEKPQPVPLPPISPPPKEKKPQPVPQPPIQIQPATAPRGFELLGTYYYKIRKGGSHTVSSMDQSFSKEVELPTPYITNLWKGNEVLKYLKEGRKNFTVKDYIGAGYVGIQDWSVIKEDNDYWYCVVRFYRRKE